MPIRSLLQIQQQTFLMMFITSALTESMRCEYTTSLLHANYSALLNGMLAPPFRALSLRLVLAEDDSASQPCRPRE